MSDTETDKGKGRGKERGRSQVRRNVGGAARSGSKRPRHSSAQDDGDQEIDSDVVLDTLLGCFRRDNTLLDRFMERLLLLPEVKSKITGYASTSVSDDINEHKEQIDSETIKSLNDSVQKLTVVVDKLQTELAKSSEKCNVLEDKCDDLEQYSRRSNIIISNAAIDNSVTLEIQVCNILNEYVTPPVEPTDIDRTHRIYRKASNKTSEKPPDIIVKFVSYRTKARILTQDPMEKLRTANDQTDDKHKIFISEDLTKTRKALFFSTRQLKKKKLIKDTFPRDGRIIAKIKDSKNDIKTWSITTESDLKAMCSRFKLPYIKPNTRRSGANLEGTDQSGSMDIDLPTSQPTSPSLLGPHDPFHAQPGASAW